MSVEELSPEESDEIRAWCRFLNRVPVHEHGLSGGKVLGYVYMGEDGFENETEQDRIDREKWGAKFEADLAELQRRYRKGKRDAAEEGLRKKNHR